MLKINKVVITSILIFTQLSLMAQNNTNSPYTRFGYGELADRSFGAGRAMGGIGYGLRSSKQINPMNPASYSSMDSLTFLFDFGASAQLSWYNDGTNRQKNVNGNVEYIAMQFPISRRIAMSVGMLPYSYVGYKYGSKINNKDNGLDAVASYVGKGGLTEAYGGISVDLWKKRLAVGLNAGYLFGNITHEQNVTFPSPGYNIVRTQEVQVRDYKLDFGIQYTHPISATENITVGFAYSPNNHLNAKSYNTLQKVTSSGGVVDNVADTITNQAFDLPNSYGAGISYVKQNKLTLAADFLYEEWGKARFFDSKDDFKNRIRVAVGGEFIPDVQNHNFLAKVRYRAGFHYSNSYLKINQTEDNGYASGSYGEYGASVGFGLPLVDSRSFVNVSFEYVKIRPEVKTMINEQYFRFTVNYTFNELWFFKRKVD
ncbi:hypothetical protein [Parabacteroides provencensis]|uniref:hypothetical protein n=1 Tax=Parabacteroides provencensis TaxID=1944636 RepID=UPI000C161845|nr:hypothetical protein [Parabacteroides provencensis]